MKKVFFQKSYLQIKAAQHFHSAECICEKIERQANVNKDFVISKRAINEKHIQIRIFKQTVWRNSFNPLFVGEIIGNEDLKIQGKFRYFDFTRYALFALYLTAFVIIGSYLMMNLLFGEPDKTVGSEWLFNLGLFGLPFFIALFQLLGTFFSYSNRKEIIEFIKKAVDE